MACRDFILGCVATFWVTCRLSEFPLAGPHGRWLTAKEAEEESEPAVSLLFRSDLFIFGYLVFCFKIILGIKYHTFYDFEVYWYLGGKISGILVSHYPPPPPPGRA